jgi:hypothetical protein
MIDMTSMVDGLSLMEMFFCRSLRRTYFIAALAIDQSPKVSG